MKIEDLSPGDIVKVNVVDPPDDHQKLYKYESWNDVRLLVRALNGPLARVYALDPRPDGRLWYPGYEVWPPDHFQDDHMLWPIADMYLHEKGPGHFEESMRPDPSTRY